MTPSPQRMLADIQLINGSTGDPVLWLDYPGRDDAILLDAGDNCALPLSRLADMRAVFISHHHVDHFIGLDRIVRANIDSDKTVSIHGPPGTIAKVYDRVSAYEYPFFPFQKIVLDLVEVDDTVFRTARLDCGSHFPKPTVVESTRESPVVFESDTVAVEACSADHTVACLSYAVVEKPGWYVDTAAAKAINLADSRVITRLLQKQRNDERLDEIVEWSGRRSTYQDLAEQILVHSNGARLAFITDTRLMGEARTRLLNLAQGASRLYCDSFYLDAQAASAEKHGHSTARQAAEFARDANVDELVLIHFASRYTGRYHLLLDEARSIFPNTRAEIRSSDRQ